MSEMTQAAQDVLAERRRQIEAEGWTPEHDDEHGNGELARAAACYTLGVPNRPWDSGDLRGTIMWPWHIRFWKPGNRRRMLVKAAALILAEIERLDRIA